MKSKQFYNMYGKPSERLILIALCKKYDCKFDIDEDTGFVALTGDHTNINTIHVTYNAIIANAYKKLALAQGTKRLSKVPIKTLTSEFMQAYAAVSYSLITGEPFMFKSKTEAHRAGLGAGE